MSRDEMLGIIGVIIILLVGGFFWFGGETEEGDILINESEVECVKVRTSCCPCNMGGKEACVLASEVEEYEESLLECSPTTLCSAVFNCEIESCGYVEGECVAT